MKKQILLFKDFNAVLPKEFLDVLKVSCQDSLIYTVRGIIDFNRWQFNYRIDPVILDAVSVVNKKHNDILDPIIEIVTISGDQFSGFIEVDDTYREHWKVKASND